MDRTASIQPEQSSGQSDETFPFVGGILALDLVNTEIMVRGKPRDLLSLPQDVERWWLAAQRHYPMSDEVRGEDEGSRVYDLAFLETIKTLRRALRNIFSASIEGTTPSKADVDVFNAVLRTGYHALELTSEGHLLPLYRTTEKSKGEVLLPIALSALQLIGKEEDKRLHKCENERCILLFYDTTKSATRRWCSLACLDRARSAQRYMAKRDSQQSS